MDQLALVVGWAVTAVFAFVFITLVALLLWVWLSITAALWYINIKTYSVKPEWRAKSFWRIRLFGYLALQFREILGIHGCTIRSENYSADFTGIIPRVYGVEK